jgi:hypothetical protein
MECTTLKNIKTTTIPLKLIMGFTGRGVEIFLLFLFNGHLHLRQQLEVFQLEALAKCAEHASVCETTLEMSEIKRV